MTKMIFKIWVEEKLDVKYTPNSMKTNPSYSGEGEGLIFLRNYTLTSS